ncbi:hypothetical protein PpBr36_02270 [Pyricularia pennisetigena]|uniref:hypothetical protein n=1 Tax=Pyricularia pennisetigena TaxID=1578925 RepID=UPI00114DCD38|nr:hypothetical protein PpBr36_02270 [Pyricularia pennisetigena]TLS30893.1 hypothetical protein PpBr36_02270 [Pyricularia pennisetigena]
MTRRLYDHATGEDAKDHNETMRAVPGTFGGAAALLPRAKKTCQYCGFDEMVFFQAQQRTAETGMKQIYVCVECSKPQTD